MYRPKHKTMTTIEKNILIALFIGRTGKHNKNLYTFQGLHDIIGDTWCKAEDLKFHCSYDWLIPVIKKIHKTIGVKTFDECTIEEWNMYKIISNLSFYQDFDNIYEYVVEFILWNNNRK